MVLDISSWFNLDSSTSQTTHMVILRSSLIMSVFLPATLLVEKEGDLKLLRVALVLAGFTTA